MIQKLTKLAGQTHLNSCFDVEQIIFLEQNTIE